MDVGEKWTAEEALVEGRILVIRGLKVLLESDLAAMYLTSKRAVNVNVAIMRSFVRLRQLLVPHEELAHRSDQLNAAERISNRVQYVLKPFNS